MADEPRQRHLQRIAWGAGALAAALAVLFYLAALGVVDAPYRSAIVPTILVLLLVNWRLRAASGGQTCGGLRTNAANRLLEARAVTPAARRKRTRTGAP